MNYRFKRKYLEVQAFQMTEERRLDNSEWPDWLDRAWNKDPLDLGALFCHGPKLYITTLGGRKTFHPKNNCWIVMEDFPISLSCRREKLQTYSVGRTHCGCVRCNRVIGVQHSVGNPDRVDIGNRCVSADKRPIPKLKRTLTGMTLETADIASL